MCSGRRTSPGGSIGFELTSLPVSNVSFTVLTEQRSAQIRSLLGAWYADGLLVESSCCEPCKLGSIRPGSSTILVSRCSTSSAPVILPMIELAIGEVATRVQVVSAFADAFTGTKRDCLVVHGGFIGDRAIRCNIVRIKALSLGMANESRY